MKTDNLEDMNIEQLKQLKKQKYNELNETAITETETRLKLKNYIEFIEGVIEEKTPLKDLTSELYIRRKICESKLEPLSETISKLEQEREKILDQIGSIGVILTALTQARKQLWTEILEQTPELKEIYEQEKNAKEEKNKISTSAKKYKATIANEPLTEENEETLLHWQHQKEKAGEYYEKTKAKRKELTQNLPPEYLMPLKKLNSEIKKQTEKLTKLRKKYNEIQSRNYSKTIEYYEKSHKIKTVISAIDVILSQGIKLFEEIENPKETQNNYKK